jgi:hypothetical protein
MQDTSEKDKSDAAQVESNATPDLSSVPSDHTDYSAGEPVRSLASFDDMKADPNPADDAIQPTWSPIDIVAAGGAGLAARGLVGAADSIVGNQVGGIGRDILDAGEGLLPKSEAGFGEPALKEAKELLAKLTEDPNAAQAQRQAALDRVNRISRLLERHYQQLKNRGFADGGEVSFDETQADPTPSAAPTTPPVAFDDLKEDPTPTGSVGDFDSLQDDGEKYGTLGQQVLTGIEGTAQGYAGPLATAAEQTLSNLGVPGLTDQDITGRAATNPVTHGLTEAAGLGLGLFTGTGEAGLISKGLEGVSGLKAMQEAGTLGKLGSIAIHGFIQNAALQGGDETTNYLLGVGNDPSAAAANILVAGALGGSIGLGAAGASSLLEKIPTNGLGSTLLGATTGVGWATATDEAKEAMGAPTIKDYLGKLQEVYKKAGVTLTPTQIKGIKFGAKLGKYIVEAPVAHGLGLIQAEQGYQKEGFVGALKGFGLGELEGFGFRQLSKPLGALVLKAMQSGSFENITQGLENAASVQDGFQKINDGIGNLFQLGSQQAVNADATDKQKDKLRKSIREGQLNQDIQATGQQVPGPPVRKFAEGGEVTQLEQPAPQGNPLLEKNAYITANYPELAMALGKATGRINTYLSQIQPQENQQRLPFDNAPSQVEQTKSYDRALGIAVKPLSILNNIKDGTLTSEHVQHFSQMYPELHQHLQKKITEKVIQSQIDGKKPSYTVRKGMSLFMGTPLDSTMTPQSIQTIQGVFAQQGAQQAQMGQPPKNKKNTSKLGEVAKESRTADQAAIARQQNGH